MVHPYRVRAMPRACRAECVGEWGVTVKAWAMPYTAADFVSTVHLGYTKLIKNIFLQ